MAIVTLLIISVALWQCRPTAAEISGYIDPSPTNNVGEGDTATFTCTVTGRDTTTQTLLWQLSYRVNNGNTMHSNFPANMTRIDLTKIPTPWTHGDYFLNFSEEGNVDIIQLLIHNVTKGDSNFQFKCAYKTSQTVRTLWFAVELVVWTKPMCFLSSSSNVPSLITMNNTVEIQLLCITTESLTLSWYTLDYETRSKIGSSAVSTNTHFQHITSNDYGREFICEATILDDPLFKLTCSVVPYNPRPVVSITSDVMIIRSGEKLTMHCINSGASSADTNYLWHIGNILLNNIQDEMIQIIQAERNSTLILGTRHLPSGNITITCEAVIHDIGSANATVTVIVISIEPKAPSASPTITNTEKTPTESQMSMLIIICSAATGGLLVIIVLILIVCCCWRRRGVSKNEQQPLKPPVAKASQDDSLTKDTVLVNQWHQNPDPSNASTMPDSSQPPSSLHGAPPIYAMPNKSRSHKVSLQQDTAEGELYHYDDVGGGPSYSNAKTSDDVNEPSIKHSRGQFEDEPSAYDDVSPETNSDTLFGTSANKRSANVEGLMYADIEISGTKHTIDDESNDEILRTDNLTVYSEVKM